jgi:hypothetical protein
MSTIHVQFEDSTEENVIAMFGCPQDETDYPNQGTIETSDPRWKAYYATLTFTLGIPEPTQ